MAAKKSAEGSGPKMGTFETFGEVAAAVPIGDSGFLVFLNDGRIVRGVVRSDGVDIRILDQGVPGTRAGRAAGNS